MSTCHLCPAGGDQVPDAELLDHLRVLHPETGADVVEQWPDGRPVIVDVDLDPAEFTEGAA